LRLAKERRRQRTSPKREKRNKGRIIAARPISTWKTTIEKNSVFSGPRAVGRGKLAAAVRNLSSRKWDEAVSQSGKKKKNVKMLGAEKTNLWKGLAKRSSHNIKRKTQWGEKGE